MNQAKNTEKYIIDNVEQIRRRIASSASKAGRDPGSVRLLAATKNRGRLEVEAALGAGVGIVGENRVQELLEKEAWLRGKAEIHFIGHLQRNKVRQVVGLVELIHSVDSVRLAAEIDGRARAAGVVQKVLIQVNVAEEDTKSGVRPGDLERLASEVCRLESLEVKGLSTIAPIVDEQDQARSVFGKLRELGVECERNIEGFGLKELSMGMTNDFEAAIEEGSTIVRIGTALFVPQAGLDDRTDKEVD